MQEQDSRTGPAALAETLALFVSDVHLQEDMPHTAAAFFSFLRQVPGQARQLYVLGDLFEYWARDDDLDQPFHRQVAQALRAVADGGVQLFWIAGNRDFLVGPRFLEAAGMQALPDPCVTEIGAARVVLVHGDAQCTDDLAYMAFRQQVRQPAWQQAFLSQPLAERKRIIAGARMESREAQRSKTAEIMDVNEGAIASVFEESGATLMIHGHTHRPGRHAYPGPLGTRLRYVLPDWDLDGSAARGGWFALDAAGVLHRHDWMGRALD